MSVLVEVVVGQLQLVEEDGLFHPVSTGGRGVGVDVEPPRHVGLSLARHHPLRVVVLVATVVERYYVHEEDVLGVWVEPFESDLECGEHPPVKNKMAVVNRIVESWRFYTRWLL